MSADLNRSIIHRFVEEFWNARDFSVADEIFSPDCVTHQLRGDKEEATSPRPPETIKKEAGEWISGFPDLKFTVVQILAETDRVATQLQVTGTHRGEWMAILPTGRSIDVPLIVIHRIKDQKIVEDWVLVGTLTLFQQLGLAAPTSELLTK
jgi:predicted ester cyclase